MCPIGNDILGELLRLREAADADFAAIAIGKSGERNYRWTYVSGGISGRCEAMAFRIGRGIGGQTLRIGRPVVWGGGTKELELVLGECPLVQAESLRTAVGIPLTIRGDAQAGVLVAGSRGVRRFVIEDLEKVIRFSERIRSWPWAERSMQNELHQPPTSS